MSVTADQNSEDRSHKLDAAVLVNDLMLELRKDLTHVDSTPLSNSPNNFLRYGESSISLSNGYTAHCYFAGRETYVIVEGAGSLAGKMAIVRFDSSKEDIYTDLPINLGTKSLSKDLKRTFHNSPAPRGVALFDSKIVEKLIDELKSEKNSARLCLIEMEKSAGSDQLAAISATHPAHAESWLAVYGAIAHSYLAPLDQSYKINTRLGSIASSRPGTLCRLSDAAQIVIEFSKIKNLSQDVFTEFNSVEEAYGDLKWLIENPQGIKLYKANPEPHFDFSNPEDQARSRAYAAVMTLERFGLNTTSIESLMEWGNELSGDQQEKGLRNAGALLSYRLITAEPMFNQLACEYKLHLNPVSEALPLVAARLLELSAINPDFLNKISGFKFLSSNSVSEADLFLKSKIPNPNGEEARLPAVVIYLKVGQDTVQDQAKEAALTVSSYLAEKFADLKDYAAELTPRSNLKKSTNPLVCISQGSGDVKDLLFRYKIYSEAPFPDLLVENWSDSLKLAGNLRDALFDPTLNGAFFHSQAKMHRSALGLL